MFLDRVCSVLRLTPDTGNANKETYIAVTGLEAVKINVQPASAETTALSEGAFGKTFTAFVQATGILEGDQLVVTGYKTFYVKGVEDFNWGPLPHYKLTLTLPEGSV